MEPTRNQAGYAGSGDIPGRGASAPTRAVPMQPRPRTTALAPSMLASYYERDTVLIQLKAAFAEGRLDDDVFDRRMREALTARTHGELAPLVADLPGAARPSAFAARPGRFAVALNGTVRCAGRWRVPGLHTTIVYRGRGELDLRAAELAGPVTTLLVAGCKSTITVFVPPGIQVQASGLGVNSSLADSLVPPGAPVVNVRGLLYKGTVEILARPR